MANMRKLQVPIISALCWLLSGFSLLGAQEKFWTLEECVSHALEHNIDIKQMGIDVERAELAKNIALGSFLPSVNANASHSWTVGLNQNITTGLLENQTTQFTSAGIDVGIDVFKGLQNQNQLSKARLAEIASKYQSQKLKEDVALNVINAYLQIIFNKEQVKNSKVQLDYQEKQENRTQELVDAGIVPAGDLLYVQATVAQTRQELIVAENAVLISRLALAQMLQIRAYETFDIADEVYEVALTDVLLNSASEIVEKAKQTQVDIQLAETNVHIAEKEVQIAKGAYLPQLRAFYSFATRAAYMDRISGMQINPDQPTQTIGVVEGTNQNVLQPNMQPIISGPESMWNQFDANKGQSFGLGVSIPIFNGLNTRNNVKMARLALNQKQNEKDLAELKLEQTVYTAYSDTQSALQTYEAAQVTLEARKRSLEYAKERYEVGLMNVFDYNQNQTLFSAAQSDLLKAKYDYVFKTKILEYYFGVPLFEN